MDLPGHYRMTSPAVSRETTARSVDVADQHSVQTEQLGRPLFFEDASGLPNRSELYPTRAAVQATADVHVIDLADEFARRRAGSDVAIVGLGYVGLPTSLAFHSAGRDVLGIDVSHARLDNIRDGRVDLLPSDRVRLGAALTDDRFGLTTDATMVRTANTVMVCVPTPVDEQLAPNLAPLQEACATVVAQARPRQVIILTSTSYVGCTHDLVVQPLRERGFVIGEDIFVAFSPERIDPGSNGHAPEDVPRVLGGATAACTARALSALGGCTSNLHPVSSLEAAEMCKLVENTFRAVNIALANEFAEIGRELDLDITEVIDAAATKPFGFMPFRPGPGVGGHCIPVDPHYLLWQLRRRRVSAPMIEQAMRGIANRPRMVAERVRTALADNGTRLTGSRVVIVGIAYKPDVEDVRDSPALEIIERLRASGAHVVYYDPLVPSVRLPGGAVLESIRDPALADADIAVLHTSHTGMSLDWLMHQSLVLDTTYKFTGLPHVLSL